MTTADRLVMGCSSSIVLEEPTPPAATPVTAFVSSIGARKSETVVTAYRRLDEEICALESTTPGARLVTAEGWVELLKSSSGTRRVVLPLEASPELPNGLEEFPRRVSTPDLIDGARKEMVQVVLRLDIVRNPIRATQQEEFIARLSRTAMEQEADHFRDEMVAHARRRSIALHSAFERLKRLYHEQDALLSPLYNGPGMPGMSPDEQRIDSELEAARDVRDRLGGAAEQWRTAGALLRAAAKALHQTVNYWELLGVSVAKEEASQTISLALDTRYTCHGALIALEAAQAALPEVEVPHVTIRQQSAVRHALIYLLTDMVQPARYQHTRDVFTVFSANVSKAVHWVHECYSSTLRQDYDSADQAATLLAKALREERMRYLRRRFPNKTYTRPPVAVG